MPLKYPFNRLALGEGEQLLFTKWNPPTESLSKYPAVAVSDRALYIGTTRFRIRWRRFPFTDLTEVLLKESPYRPWPRIVLTGAVMAVFVWWQLSTGHFWGALIAVGVLFAIGYVYVRGLRHRTDLVVCLRNGRFLLRTPVGVSDDKAFDRRMLREAIEILRQRGITVVDEFASEPNPSFSGCPAGDGCGWDAATEKCSKGADCPAAY